jgi:hypothetical protein
MAERTNRGQAKEHVVLDADGNELTMTQKEWRERDKSAGYTRPEDEAEEAEVIDVEPVEEETLPS